MVPHKFHAPVLNMSDGEGKNSEGGSPAAEERKRQSKLLARTRNAGKQSVVFDEGEDEDGGHVTTSIQTSSSLAKTWSPASLAVGGGTGATNAAKSAKSCIYHDARRPGSDAAALKVPRIIG